MSLSDMIRPETKAEHRATWYVWIGGERERANRHHGGSWVGWDVECSCGKGSHTGGAIKTRVREWLFDHRLDAQTEAEMIAAGDATRDADGDLRLTAQGRARLATYTA